MDRESLGQFGRAEGQVSSSPSDLANFRSIGSLHKNTMPCERLRAQGKGWHQEVATTHWKQMEAQGNDLLGVINCFMPSNHLSNHIQLGTFLYLVCIFSCK